MIPLPFIRTVRARLMLWNMLVLALVLVALGTVLRVGVAGSFMASVDHDLAGRSAKHTFFWANVPEASHEPRKPLPYRPPDKRSDLPSSTPQALPPTSQNSARLPAGPQPLPPPRWGVLVAEGVFDLKGVQSWPNCGRQMLWDREAFKIAARGQRTYSYSYDGDVHLRVLSVPLMRKSGEIAGVAQLAYALTEVDRDSGIWIRRC